jgi:Zn-dependent protease
MGTLAFALSMAAGVGFGWAKPVPVEPRNFRRPRRDMMWVALAGPAVNFALAILSLVVFLLMRRFGLDQGFAGEPLGLMLQAGFSINTALAAFNLIPILPFDGGRILMGVLPARLAWPYSRSEPYGFFIVLGLILLGWLHIVFWPIYTILRAAELALVRNLLRVTGLY